MARFDPSGVDSVTYAPIALIDQRDSQWKDVRLSFDAWDWLAEQLGSEVGEAYVDDYYLNGYGVQGLVQACRLSAGLNVEAEGIDYDSEGDTCFIHFSRLEDAIETAQLAAEMLKDRAKIVAMVQVARENGLED